MKYRLNLILLIICLTLSGCMSQAAINKQNEKFIVVASFYPVYAITNFIIQNSTGTNLISLTGNNQEVCLHNYSLKPHDMAQIETADVFLTCGDDISSNMEIPHKINVSDSEHPWMSLDSAITMARTIANALAEKDWKNKTTYLENSDRFAEEARNKQSIMKNKIESLPSRSIISLDNSTSIFANSIGLSVITFENDSHDSENVTDIPKYLSIIEEYGINTFLIPKDNEDSLQLKILKNELANKNIQIKIIELSTFLNGDNSINDYFNQMNENFEKIYNALK